MDIGKIITDLWSSGGQLIVDNIVVWVVGYIFGVVITPKVASEFIIGLLKKAPLPDSIKIPLFQFLDLMLGQLCKSIPNTKEEIAAWLKE